MHGCPNLVYVGSRCEQHRLPPTPRPRDLRPSAGARGYGHAWRKKRGAWLISHPWCADPLSRHAGSRVVATMVDHIVPLRRGGRDDETNYQSLCVSCHNVKTSIDGSRGDKCFRRSRDRVVQDQTKINVEIDAVRCQRENQLHCQ
ncbi:MAG: HNH endonuclease [Bryobacterales bacterium]|nr:HNH endonuclease [Bryobacterales bacterium]